MSPFVLAYWPWWAAAFLAALACAALEGPRAPGKGFLVGVCVSLAMTLLVFGLFRS